jgi:hypothetical protein
MRWVYKWHKWLAVSAGVLTLMWFVSGIVMVAPGSWIGPPPPIRPAGSWSGPGFRDVAVGVPQAIAAVEADLGGKADVTNVSFRRVAGRLVYHLETANHGSRLVDATDGKIFALNPHVVRQIVEGIAERTGPPLEVILLQEHDASYPQGPLPVYRVPLGDARGTVYYVEAETGEVRASNRATRFREFFSDLHGFGFLSAFMANEGRRATLILFSVAGTLMSIFGLWILWLQLRNWQRRRAST